MNGALPSPSPPPRPVAHRASLARAFRRASAALVLTGLGSCAEDPVIPVTVQRLLVDAKAWQGGGQPAQAVVGGELRAARELPSGAWASRTCTIPAQPCWLHGFVAPAGGWAPDPAEDPGTAPQPAVTLTVEVEHQGRRTRVVQARPAPEPLRGGFGEFRADLREWAGEEVTLHLEGQRDDGGAWWLAGLVVEPQEVFDSRVRTVVLILVDPPVLARAAEWADDRELPGLRRLARRSELQRGVDGHGAGRDALLAACTSAMLEEGRECFGFGVAPPEIWSEHGPAGFDLWRSVDPFAGGTKETSVGLAELLHRFGRPRPQSIFVAVDTRAAEAEVSAGVLRILDQLQADQQWSRSTVVITSLPADQGTTSLLWRSPDMGASEGPIVVGEGEASLSELPDRLRGRVPRP